MLINLQSKRVQQIGIFVGYNSPITVSPSTLQESQYLSVLAGGESPSQGGGGRPVTDSGLVKERVISTRGTYSTGFKDVVVIGCD
jgi:hypothetical protein